MSNIREHLQTTLVSTERILGSVANDDWAQPSVCDDWTVRQLAEHLVGSCALTASVLSAQPSPGRPEYAETPNDQLATEYGHAGRVVLDALADPAVLTQTVIVGFGPVPGAVAARLCLVETIVHGWDVAHSTGQEVTFDDAAVAEALQFSEGMMSQVPAERSPFAASRAVAGDAPPLDRLVALLGRDPSTTTG
ncbi:MAG: TIGR03086 family metal-binding protein [Ornithinimicrobium sp.]